MTTRVFRLDKHELTIYDGTWDYYLEKTHALDLQAH
jgi:hypothetical protein